MTVPGGITAGQSQRLARCFETAAGAVGDGDAGRSGLY